MACTIKYVAFLSMRARPSMFVPVSSNERALHMGLLRRFDAARKDVLRRAIGRRSGRAHPRFGRDEDCLVRRRDRNPMPERLSLHPWLFGPLALVLGCGGPSSRVSPAAPLPSRPPPTETSVPPAPSPNVLHDRRAEPGVRAAPKPLVIGKARSVSCGKLSLPAKDAESFDLLSGRLRVRPPAGAKIPPALADSPPVDEESRVVVEGGRVSLAIVARETLQLDPDLYEPDADSPTKPSKLDVEAAKFLKATFPSDEPLDVVPVEIGTSTKLRAYAARPPRPNASPGKDTALVLALLVAQDDGALQSVGFYVRGETVRNATGGDLVGCTRLAERIASTLTPGPRKLERAAGRRHVADISKDEELAVTVPADYVALSMSDGARIVKMRPLSLYPGSIVVSIAEGGDKKLAAPEGAGTAIQGTLLGHPMEWRGERTVKGGLLFAAEPVDPNDKSRMVAVLVKATRQAKALDEMRRVAETLTVVRHAP